MYDNAGNPKVVFYYNGVRGTIDQKHQNKRVMTTTPFRQDQQAKVENRRRKRDSIS